MKKKKKKSSSRPLEIEDMIELAKKNKLVEKPKKEGHYIDNATFLSEIIKWKKSVQEAENSGDPLPPVTDYIARCFFEIGTNLAKKPNFVNYPFKEDMIGDAVENCLMYCNNFDPKKSENPFSYFTQITYFAFLRRIQKEKKQKIIRFKYLRSLGSVDETYLREYMKIIGISEEEATQLDEKTEEKPARKSKTKKNKPDIFK